MKASLQAGLLLLCACSISVLSFEFVLRRMRLDPQEEKCMAGDPVVHHSFKPGCGGVFRAKEFTARYDINSLGLRDREFAVPKPRGVFRILSLGDSFAEGYGVEASESFAKALERRLNSSPRGNRSFEVVNAGTRSYSPLLFYLSLARQDKLIGLRPDLVIVNLNAGDIIDDSNYERQSVRDNQGLPVACPPPVEPPPVRRALPLAAGLRAFLEKRTKTYPFFQRLSWKLRGLPGPVPGDPATDGFWLTRGTASRSEMEAYWSRTRKYLRLTKDFLSSRGIKLLVVTVPHGNLVGASEWALGRKRFGFEPRVYPSDFFGWLAEDCRQDGIPALDSTPGFIAAENGSPGRLFFPFDGHFTREGHEVYAGIVYDRLRLDPGLLRLRPQRP